MRIEVTRRFRDLDALTDPSREGDEDPVHEVGAKLTVDKYRGADLVERGFAVDLAPASAPAKTPRKTAKKRTAPAPAPAPVTPPNTNEPPASSPASPSTPAPAGN